MSWPMRPVNELCELAVDCVNKTAPVVDYETEFKMIRTTNVKNGFIDVEGRYPRLYIAAHIASATDDKAQYIRNRAFNDAHYKQLVIEYLKKYGRASRRDIDALLIDKLSDVLGEEQKRNKVRNLLYAMSRRDKTICNTGSGKRSEWVLVLDEKERD